jgi:hypothetical protein
MRDPVADLAKAREKMVKRNAAWYDKRFNNMRKEEAEKQREEIDEQFNTKALRYQIRILEYLLS